MPTRLILVGGFLGAGKTTLLMKAAEKLRNRGLTVGLVTNDQAADLVDTALVKRMDLEVTEVAGGCFCCNFDDLMKSIDALEQKVKPDVILAEPVGSCTDLMATVMRPLSMYHADRFVLSPFTVLTDPHRKLEEFDETVGYLYDRQLYEADSIVVSKMDSVDQATLKSRVNLLEKSYPGAKVFALSSKEDLEFDDWLDHVMTENSAVDKTMELDYAVYTRAEAVLGWLNGKGELKSDAPFSPTAFIATLSTELQKRLRELRAEIAHFKVYVSVENDGFKASLTGLHTPLSWDVFSGDRPTDHAKFIVNARVNMEPEELEEEMRNIFERTQQLMGVRATFEDFRCFSPPPPEPTHRITV